MTVLPLNELPRHNPWPSRLLGLSPWEPKRKTLPEVLREHERDKWGTYLETLRKAGGPITLETVCAEMCPDRAPAPSLNAAGNLVLLDPIAAIQQTRNLMRRVLHSVHVDKNKPLVELGAGFGNIILWLAAQEEFRDTPIYAADVAPSGVELIREIGKSMNLHPLTGTCNFLNEPMMDFSIPENATIFTCYAAFYIEEGSDRFLRSLLQLKPSRVVFLEPFYESCDESTLLGAMGKRYIEVNGYNKDLWATLKKFQARGEIEIISSVYPEFAENPLLVPSCVTWHPTIH